jgi:hypothetical protein
MIITLYSEHDIPVAGDGVLSSTAESKSTLTRPETKKKMEDEDDDLLEGEVILLKTPL